MVQPSATRSPIQAKYKHMTEILATSFAPKIRNSRPVCDRDGTQCGYKPTTKVREEGGSQVANLRCPRGCLGGAAAAGGGGLLGGPPPPGHRRRRGVQGVDHCRPVQRVLVEVTAVLLPVEGIPGGRGTEEAAGPKPSVCEGREDGAPIPHQPLDGSKVRCGPFGTVLGDREMTSGGKK